MTPPLTETEAPPTHLFIYMRAHVALSDIEHSWLKVSNPKFFNDPFEFLPRVHEPTKDDVIAMYHSDERFQFTSEEEFVSAFMDGKDKTIDEYQSRAAGNFGKGWGVICFSFCPHNILMWSHYADSHKGVVLGFKTGGNLFHNRHLDKVIYDSERIVVNPLKNDQARREALKSLTKSKSPLWTYEQEYRLIVPLNECVESLDDQSRVTNYIQFDINDLTYIGFGCRCEPKIKEVIYKSIKARNYDHIQAYEFKADKSNYAVVENEYKGGFQK